MLDSAACVPFFFSVGYGNERRPVLVYSSLRCRRWMRRPPPGIILLAFLLPPPIGKDLEEEDYFVTSLFHSASTPLFSLLSGKKVSRTQRNYSPFSFFPTPPDPSGRLPKWSGVFFLFLGVFMRPLFFPPHSSGFAFGLKTSGWTFFLLE